MQLQFPFSEPPDSGAAAVPAAADAGAPGILSGRRWRGRPAADPGRLDALRAGADDLPDVLLAILAARGTRTAAAAAAFLAPSLEQLPDPFGLPEMDRAAGRLLRAARRGEAVAIHGDFDVDGLTGSALLGELVAALADGGARARLHEVFVPDRGADGYGVSAAALRRWADQGVDLVLTVDTGAAAAAEITEAARLGLEVVVLDHHLVGERPAAAVAVVNSSAAGAAPGVAGLCGAGVAFQLARAVRALAPACLPADFETSVLDLAALGTIADQVPLLGANRVIVSLGLTALGRSPRPGLRALQEVAGLRDGRRPAAEDVAYQLAPRLNACGRIGRVAAALALLRSREPAAARDLAEEADRTNQLRRLADRELLRSAQPQAEAELARGVAGLVLAGPDWHHGIIGIAAARLVDLYRVPAVLIACEGEQARGSARSVPGLDIKAVLDRCAHLLDRHGGHAQAAGFALPAGRLADFKEAFLAALAVTPPPPPPPREWDLELPLPTLPAAAIEDIVAGLDRLEPFGRGNRRPVFLARGLRVRRPPQFLGGGEHLRFAFAAAGGDGAGALGREFVCFRGGPAWRDWLGRGGEPERREWEILFRLGRSHWRPRSGPYDPVQQQLIDLRPADGR